MIPAEFCKKVNNNTRHEKYAVLAHIQVVSCACACMWMIVNSIAMVCPSAASVPYVMGKTLNCIPDECWP
jgi:hypothetical protein